MQEVIISLLEIFIYMGVFVMLALGFLFVVQLFSDVVVIVLDWLKGEW